MGWLRAEMERARVRQQFRPVELSTPEFYTLEELLVDLGVPLIIDGTRTSDRIVAAINRPAEHYLT